MADREVRLGRAKWISRDRIRLRFDPFAYRYVRLKVLARDGHTCYWCGGVGNTMDHVLPWSKGGRTNMANCICACEECNGSRGDMPADEFARIMNVTAPRPDEWGGNRPPARVVVDGTGPRSIVSARTAVAAVRSIPSSGTVAATAEAPAAAASPAPARPLPLAPMPLTRPRRALPLRELLDPYGPVISMRLVY